MLNQGLDIIVSKMEELEHMDIEIILNSDDEAIGIHLFSKDEIEEGQLGYRVDEIGNSLTGMSEGDWNQSWYVIGYDEDLGDPIFVDVGNKNYPVMTAAHGEGNWQPEVLFLTFGEFLTRVSK